MFKLWVENENSAKTCQVCRCQLSDESSNIPKNETDEKDEISTEQKKTDKSKIIIVTLIAAIIIVIIVGVAIIVNLARQKAINNIYNALNINVSCERMFKKIEILSAILKLLNILLTICHIGGELNDLHKMRKRFKRNR